MTELELALSRACNAIRQKLSEANVRDFDLKIEISGRVDSMEPLKVEYAVGDFGNRVEGGVLSSVVMEYLRRKGWTDTNEVKALPPPVDFKKVLDDEIPF